MEAQIKSAVAAPPPALKAFENPRLTPSSRISIPIGPTGIAIPYPAITPCRNASTVSGFYSEATAETTYISHLLIALRLVNDSHPFE